MYGRAPGFAGNPPGSQLLKDISGVRLPTLFRHEQRHGRSGQQNHRHGDGQSRIAAYKDPFVDALGIGWQNIEVQHNDKGAPFILLHGAALEKAQALIFPADLTALKTGRKKKSF